MINFVFIICSLFFSKISLAQKTTTALGNELDKESYSEDIEYKYSSFHLQSPFVPPLVSDHSVVIKIPVTNALQLFKTSDLKVVGIWSIEPKKYKALVITPKNEGVIIKPGDFIGKEGGTVKNIEKNKIIIRQFSLAANGSRLFHDRFLYLNIDDFKKNNTNQDIIINSSPSASTF